MPEGFGDRWDTHNEQALSTTMTNMKDWWTQITKTHGQGDEVQRTRLAEGKALFNLSYFSVIE